MATAARKAPVSFPPIPVGIYRKGKLVRTAKLTDPRPGFCKAVKALGVGLTALPTTGRLHFRVGVYEPGKEDKVKYVGPKFEPCHLDAAAMKSAIDRFNNRERRLRIGVFLVETAEGGAV